MSALVLRQNGGPVSARAPPQATAGLARLAALPALAPAPVHCMMGNSGQNPYQHITTVSCFVTTLYSDGTCANKC